MIIVHYLHQQHKTQSKIAGWLHSKIQQNQPQKLDWNVTDKWILFEQVRHCLGAPLHWGPGANCPCCLPVGGTACNTWRLRCLIYGTSIGHPTLTGSAYPTVPSIPSVQWDSGIWSDRQFPWNLMANCKRRITHAQKRYDLSMTLCHAYMHLLCEYIYTCTGTLPSCVLFSS